MDFNNTAFSSERAVDELGRIVLPQEIRTALNINHSDMLHITSDGISINLSLVPSARCVACKNEKDIYEYSDMLFICSHCLELIEKFVR